MRKSIEQTQCGVALLQFGMLNTFSFKKMVCLLSPHQTEESDYFQTINQPQRTVLRHTIFGSNH
ncbi:MAG: hypothetical protein LAT51_13335 [Flavobacteriaceae bacterium]|nr:hypothetical protein [Flavobacteriaceae bacterium]